MVSANLGNVIYMQGPSSQPSPIQGDVAGAWVAADGISLYVWMNKGAGNTPAVFNMGSATNNSQNTNITITLNSPGFKSDGTSNWVARTVYAPMYRRLAYNSNTSIAQTGTSSAVTNVFALSDPVYALDGNLLLSIKASTYSNCAVTWHATCTNNSTLMFPKTLGWLLQGDWQLVSSNYNIPCFGYSLLGTNTYHAIAYQGIASDQHGNWYTSAVQAATAIVLPTTNSLDANPSPQALIPMSCAGMTIGDYITNYVTIWPTLGTNACVLNSMNAPTVDHWIGFPGNPWFHPWITVCDRTTNYGCYAFVSKSGNDTSGRCVLTNITDFAHAPPAFLTYAGAAAAMRGTNAQTYMPAAHDDYCGTMYMGSGSYAYASTSTSVTNQHSYLTVMPTPTNGANLIFSSSSTFGGNAAMRLCLSNVLWTTSAAGQLYNYNAFRFVNSGFSGITASSGALIELGVVFAEQCNFTNFDQGFTAFSTDYTVWAIVRGCRAYGLFGSSGQRNIQPYCVVGNDLAPTNTFQISTSATYPGTNYPDGFYVGYNTLRSNVTQGTCINIDSASPAQSLSNGCLIANNIVEMMLADNGLGNISIWFKADDTTGSTTNASVVNNVTLGGRWNFMYNWQANGTTGAVVNVTARGNIGQHLCSKHDSEATSNSARTNAWWVEFGTGFGNNVFIDMTNYQGYATASKTFYLDFPGINSYVPPFSATWPTSDPPQGLYANDFSVFQFKNYQAWMGRSTNNVGGGDYHLATAAYWATAIPGSGCMPFDLEGAAYATNNLPGAYASTK